MKVVLMFLALMISTVLVAQNNTASKKETNSPASIPVSANKKTADKKVHYVDKRTHPVHNNSNGNSNSPANKKPVVRKSEKQEKVVQK